MSVIITLLPVLLYCWLAVGDLIGIGGAAMHACMVRELMLFHRLQGYTRRPLHHVEGPRLAELEHTRTSPRSH